MDRKPFGIQTLSQYPKALRRAREVAKRMGYAIGLHGSRTYDLDLIACPWTEQCASAEELAIAIASELGWYLLRWSDGTTRMTQKPHGRMGFLIYGSKHAHIDLSVMPRCPGG